MNGAEEKKAMDRLYNLKVGQKVKFRKVTKNGVGIEKYYGEVMNPDHGRGRVAVIDHLGVTHYPFAAHTSPA